MKKSTLATFLMSFALLVGASSAFADPLDALPGCPSTTPFSISNGGSTISFNGSDAKAVYNYLTADAKPGNLTYRGAISKFTKAGPGIACVKKVESGDSGDCWAYYCTSMILSNGAVVAGPTF